MHAGEPNVGHTIVDAKQAEHRSADRLRTHLGTGVEANLLFDLADERFNLQLVERAVLRCCAKPTEQLGSFERLAVSVSFDHDKRHFLDPLERGVAPRTCQALSTPADHRTVFGGPRVDDLVVVPGAPRTSHG